MRPGSPTWKCEPALALDDQADGLATAVFFRAFRCFAGAGEPASEVAGACAVPRWRLALRCHRGWACTS